MPLSRAVGPEQHGHRYISELLAGGCSEERAEPVIRKSGTFQGLRETNNSDARLVMDGERCSRRSFLCKSNESSWKRFPDCSLVPFLGFQCTD